jgi:hypothetical protein
MSSIECQTKMNLVVIGVKNVFGVQARLVVQLYPVINAD